VLRAILIGLLLLLIARLFWRVMDGVFEGFGGTSRQRRARGREPVKLARDPVCGTFVAPANALSLTSGGSTHYFCSEDCKSKFRG
jgi:YHS domain-containing protein